MLLWTDYYIVRWIAWLAIAAASGIAYLLPLELLKRDQGSEADEDVKRRSKRKRPLVCPLQTESV